MTVHDAPGRCTNTLNESCDINQLLACNLIRRPEHSGLALIAFQEQSNRFKPDLNLLAVLGEKLSADRGFSLLNRIQELAAFIG